MTADTTSQQGDQECQSQGGEPKNDRCNPELAKKAFDTALRQMREIEQIVTDANRQATDAIVRRIPESLDEIKDVLKLPQRPDAS